MTWQKKAEKGKEISEDDSKKLQSEIQGVTDEFVGEIDRLMALKEEEFLQV